MTPTPRHTPRPSGSDLDHIVAPDAGGRPSDTDIVEDSEEHVPEEVHSDPELWFEICNDPAIWPENRVAAYRAALRGEPNWQFAFADDFEGGKPTDTKAVGRNSRPPYLRRVK
jgi:hypothetical protein